MSQKAHYVRLGNSGLHVSVPIISPRILSVSKVSSNQIQLGGMSIGNPRWSPWAVPEPKAFPLLEAAWDAGVTTWDTANMYTNRESESLIGKFIQQYNIPRNNLVLMTKLRFPVDHEEPSTVTSFFRQELKDDRDYVNHIGLSRTAIFNQVEDSLRRLAMTYIDILFIHTYDLDTPFAETMLALHDLVKAGKVRYLGASNLRAWQFIEMNNIAQLNGWTQFTCVQVEHSLLYRTEELELFSYCNYKGIGITTYSPLMDGHLVHPAGRETPHSNFIKGLPFEKKRRDSDLKIIQHIKELAQKHSWAMCQVALTWSLTKVSSFIVGANTPERLREAIVSGKTLDQEEIKYLEELYEAQPPRF